MKTLKLYFLIFSYFAISLQYLAADSNFSLDQIVFRQLSHAEAATNPNIRQDDLTGFDQDPSDELKQAANQFYDAHGYHVFDVGLYYMHTFTLSKAQELIDGLIAQLDQQYEKYVLFGYGLGTDGLGHQAHVKWGNESSNIPEVAKTEFLEALGVGMIDYSKALTLSAQTVDETEIWALNRITHFFNFDANFISIYAGDENDSGLQASQLLRSSSDPIVSESVFGLTLNQEAIMLSPAGVPVKIPKGSLVSFVLNSTFEDLVFEGVVTKFITPEGKIFIAKASLKDGSTDQPLDFVGFIDASDWTKKYAYEGFEISTTNFHQMLLGYVTTASAENCSSTNLRTITFKPNQQDKKGINDGSFKAQLSDVGEEQSDHVDIFVNPKIKSFRYCLPTHTAQDINTAEQRIFNPYGNGGVRVIANAPGESYPTFYYAFYDYEDPEITQFLYWDREKLIWKYYSADEDYHPYLPGSIELMGVLWREVAEAVHGFFTTADGGFDYHAALDVIGAIPIVGAIADVVNGIIYAVEGDRGNAVLSFAAIVPGIGTSAVFGKYAGPYLDNLWDAAKKIKVVKGTKVCAGGLQGGAKPGLVKSSGACTYVAKSIDVRSILKKAKEQGIPEVSRIKLQKDLATGSKEFVDLMKKPGGVKAWGVLRRNGRNILRTDVDALGSLTNLISNPKLASKLPGKSAAEIEDLLGKMKGWGDGTNGASYKQVCDKVNELVDELPTNTSNFDKYLGSGGFGNGNVYTNRHSWVQLERMLEGSNKSFVKSADEVIFENPINGTPFGNSVSDIYIRNGSQIVEVETKAGLQFFEGVSGSNFATQSANSLARVSSVSDYKVILNPERVANLSNADKISVVNAWKNHSGNVLNDNSIVQLFTNYWTDVPLISNPAQFENLLKTRNDWFDDIFKHNIE